MGQNVFQTNNKYFEQTSETAMGNPLPSFLTEIFTSRFQTEMKKYPDFLNVWGKYIDDFFAIINKHFNINSCF